MIRIRVRQKANEAEDDKSAFKDVVKNLKEQPKMDNLVNALNQMSEKQRKLLSQGFGGGDYATKMEIEEMPVKAKDLKPTQNEIDVGKSLSYQLSGENPEQVEAILKGGPVTVNLPLVVYEHKGKYYIVDGHHRWSQVFLLNPGCTINSIVFKNSAGENDQDPVDMLRDFQGAIMIATGKVPSSTVSKGNNLFDWSSDKIASYVQKNIQDGTIGAYRAYFDSDVDADDIARSISSNASIMQKSNQPVPGAPSRAVMPQTDTQNNAGLKAAMKGMTDI